MSFKTFFKQCLLEYFVVSACISAAIGVLGLLINPTAKFGYESYFSPFVFAFISIIPSFVMYSKKELPMRQLLFRKVFHLLVLEAMLIGFAFWQRLITSISEIALFGIGVMVVYLVMHFVRWISDKKDADEINNWLQAMQASNTKEQ